MNARLNGVDGNPIARNFSSQRFQEPCEACACGVRQNEIWNWLTYCNRCDCQHPSPLALTHSRYHALTHGYNGQQILLQGVDVLALLNVGETPWWWSTAICDQNVNCSQHLRCRRHKLRATNIGGHVTDKTLCAVTDLFQRRRETCFISSAHHNANPFVRQCLCRS